VSDRGLIQDIDSAQGWSRLIITEAYQLGGNTPGGTIAIHCVLACLAQNLDVSLYFIYIFKSVGILRNVGCKSHFGRLVPLPERNQGVLSSNPDLSWWSRIVNCCALRTTYLHPIVVNATAT
jgi:hypothetical protein